MKSLESLNLVAVSNNYILLVVDADYSLLLECLKWPQKELYKCSIHEEDKPLTQTRKLVLHFAMK